MKTINLALNAIIMLSATVFLAYIGLYYFDFGLFKMLPQAVSGIFARHDALQYVALGLFVAALIAKSLVGRAIKRKDTQKQV